MTNVFKDKLKDVMAFEKQRKLEKRKTKKSERPNGFNNKNKLKRNTKR